MELWLGSTTLGLCYGFLAMGVFITMRVYNFPDITADGSLTLGASVSAALMVAGVSPYMSLLVAILSGFFAGTVTGFIHTKFRINGLLSGILVTTALYSINLRIMGRSNIPLLNVPETVLTFIEQIAPFPKPFPALIYFFLFAFTVAGLLMLLFHTDFGLAMRATGDNEIMISANGVNTDVMKVVGIGLSNAIIALCGALVCQYQGFSDINMGTGTIVYGLASVIIGEAIVGLIKKKSIGSLLMSVIVGAVIFRLLVGLALISGMNQTDLKLVTALFVLLAVALPQLRLLRR
ncbi:MAG: ABC transporter permease [Chloroherpetonaceae bacterium]|nr:ABC transporter permease [Chloroherpetonaceae bacterium]